MHWARTMTAAVATLTTTVIAVALTLTAVGDARAQEPMVTSATTAKRGFHLPDRPFRFRAGAYLPTDGKAKERLGSNFPSLGLSVDIAKTQWLVPVTLEIYSDFYRRIRKTDDFGRFEAESWSIGLGARYDLAPHEVNPRFNPYAGAGISLSSSYVKQDQYLGSASVPGVYIQSSRRTTLGGKFYLGIEHVRTGFFGEVAYEFAPKPSVFGEGVPLSGTHINLGYHF